MSDLIDAATIADLIALDESAMVETITLTSVTRTPDGGGGYTETPSSTTTTGYFWSVSGDEAGEQQIKARGKHRIAIPRDVVVAPTSTVTIGGTTYAIKYVFPVHSYDTSRIIGLEDA